MPVIDSCNNTYYDSNRLFVSALLGAEEKMNVELIVPIGAVVIAMFFWLLIVFVIRNRKTVITPPPFPSFLFVFKAVPLNPAHETAHSS